MPLLTEPSCRFGSAFFLILRIESRTFHMLSKCLTADLCPASALLLNCVLNKEIQLLDMLIEV